jgi:hypothetical protein
MGGLKHTFIHGEGWLISIGFTNEFGHSVCSITITLFGAEHGTSTFVPVGNLYVDVNSGYMSCTSMFRGHDVETIQCGNCDRDEGK